MDAKGAAATEEVVDARKDTIEGKLKEELVTDHAEVHIYACTCFPADPYAHG